MLKDSSFVPQSPPTSLMVPFPGNTNSSSRERPFVWHTAVANVTGEEIGSAWPSQQDAFEYPRPDFRCQTSRPVRSIASVKRVSVANPTPQRPPLCGRQPQAQRLLPSGRYLTKAGTCTGSIVPAEPNSSEKDTVCANVPQLGLRYRTRHRQRLACNQEA